MQRNAYAYDRAKIYANVGTGTIPYLQGGEVLNVSITLNRNSRVNHGFSQDGYGTSATLGNITVGFSWTEYVQDSANYFDWDAFLIANPDFTLTMVAFNLLTGQLPAKQFTFSKIVIIDNSNSFPEEGQSGKRSLSFQAVIAK